MMIGQKIALIPATLQDRIKIFEWLAHSDLTAFMMGPPNFPDNPIPTWDFFKEDYHPGFFDDLNPYEGRSFIIEVDGQQVGHINYNEFDEKNNTVELDIWLNSSTNCNKGYGTDAISTLCHYLHKTMGCKAFILAPSARNQRAIRAYEKAGFVKTDIKPDNFIPDYFDTVVMIKKIP